jgi:hypothetical protein
MIAAYFNAQSEQAVFVPLYKLARQRPDLRVVSNFDTKCYKSL